MNRTQRILIIITIILGFIVMGIWIKNLTNPTDVNTTKSANSSATVSSSSSLDNVPNVYISQSELVRHNGTDPTLPIYIAVNGIVYDVTAGKKFYQEGGAYHFIAGTDATKALEPVGTEIITNKYKAIGKLTQ
jgi:predicted heme/steroid binding protein